MGGGEEFGNEVCVKSVVPSQFRTSLTLPPQSLGPSLLTPPHTHAPAASGRGPHTLRATHTHTQQHPTMAPSAQSLYLLHESASGYALLHAHGLDAVGASTDAVQASVTELDRFGKVREKEREGREGEGGRHSRNTAASRRMPRPSGSKKKKKKRGIPPDALPLPPRARTHAAHSASVMLSRGGRKEERGGGQGDTHGRAAGPQAPSHPPLSLLTPPTLHRSSSSPPSAPTSPRPTPWTRLTRCPSRRRRPSWLSS